MIEPMLASPPPVPPGAPPGAARTRAVLAAILAAALLARLAPASWMSYFGDEVYFLDTARHGLRAALEHTERDVHPPLFNLLLALWLRLVPLFPEWGPRLLPIAIGLLWVIAVRRLAALSLGRRGALVAAAVVGLHPMAVQFTEPVRWYGLLALATTMVIIHLQRALAEGRRSDFAWLAIWNAVAGWTSILGWVVTGASLALWLSPRPPDAARVPWRRVLASYAAAMILLIPVAVVVIPQVLYFRSQVESTGLRAGLLFKPAYLAFALAAGQTSYPWDAPTLAALVVFAAGLATTLWCERRGMRFGAPLAVWLPAIAAGLLVITSISAPHYYLALLGGVAIAVGWLAELPGKAPRVALIGFAAVVAIGLTHLERGLQYQREEFLDPWRGIVADVRERARPGDLVLFSHPSVGLYAAGDPRFRVVLAPRDAAGALTAVAGGRVFALISPLSGMKADDIARERWLADSLAARGYAQVADSGLVRSDAPEARRRFSGRPFPAWRVRLLEWRSPGGAAPARGARRREDALTP